MPLPRCRIGSSEPPKELGERRLGTPLPDLMPVPDGH
ncbi:MAG: hypothetical protein RLZZ63_1486, partial [Gemmatimonadota bacterium]